MGPADRIDSDLGASELPAGFGYPEPFLRVVRLGLTNLEPWQVLDGRLLRRRQQGVGTPLPGPPPGGVRAGRGAR